MSLPHFSALIFLNRSGKVHVLYRLKSNVIPALPLQSMAFEGEGTLQSCLLLPSLRGLSGFSSGGGGGGLVLHKVEQSPF